MNNLPNFRIILTLCTIGIVVLLGFFLLITANEDQSIDDSSAAENNCCADEACSNYNGDFNAGYFACVNGECDKCAGGSRGECNENFICGPGENHVNCPIDCDVKGFSELPTDEICKPFISTEGNGQCDEDVNLRCVICPEAEINNELVGRCSLDYTDSVIVLNDDKAEAYKANQNFIDTYCKDIPPSNVGTCLPIDSDQDSKLTVTDLSAFALEYSKNCTPSTQENFYGQCGSMDTNSDNKIDVIDLAAFALYYNKDSCIELITP